VAAAAVLFGDSDRPCLDEPKFISRPLMLHLTFVVFDFQCTAV